LEYFQRYVVVLSQKLLVAVTVIDFLIDMIKCKRKRHFYWIVKLKKLNATHNDLFRDVCCDCYRQEENTCKIDEDI